MVADSEARAALILSGSRVLERVETEMNVEELELGFLTRVLRGRRD